MPAPPLTHHEILPLVEPFARQGRQVDLAASDRTARRLAFRPLQRDDGLLETLALDAAAEARFVLTRTLTRPDGLAATAQAAGPDAGVLLQRLQAVPATAQFAQGPGHAVARCVEVDAAGTRFVRGSARLDGLALAIEVTPVKGVAAHLTLTPAPGVVLALPEDVLAVIGWDWARLEPRPPGWSTRRRLRGDNVRRAATAQAALDTAAAHLARVLAEPPAQYHLRHRWARWGVVLRRAIPSLTALGLIGGALALPKLSPQTDAKVWLALHYVPIGLLALSFCLQELPRFEIPPLPRRRRAASWREGPPAPAAAPAHDNAECTATR